HPHCPSTFADTWSSKSCVICRKGLPPNLQYLHIHNCQRLRPSVGFVSLQKFTIGGRESGDILEALRNSIWELSSLNSLDEKGLGHLTSLQVLNILQCESLECLQGEGLGHHTSLQVLHILQCSSLECLQGDGLRHLTSLQQIHIYGCLSLQFLPEDSFFSEISPFVCLGVKV
ncbi:unnamed protein product, partial [Prunus brigantina]